MGAFGGGSSQKEKTKLGAIGGGSSQKEEKWGLTRQKQWLNKWIKIKKQ